MKKILLVMSMLIAFVFPAVGEATSVDSDIPNSEGTVIRPRSVITYKFSTIPPKKFNGMTLLYYEYNSKYKVYIGYYS